MALESEKLLDDVGWHILRSLQEDARISWSELGRRVGLSSPAVVERVRRMEEAGIITAYRAEVDLSKLGYPILAFMRFGSMPGESSVLSASFQKHPEVLECHRVTGSDDYIVKVAVSSVAHLEQLVDQFTRSQITTLIVLSSPITHRVIENRPEFNQRS